MFWKFSLLKLSHLEVTKFSLILDIFLKWWIKDFLKNLLNYYDNLFFSDFSVHTIFFFGPNRRRKYGPERLSDFPEVTQQTHRQGRNKVGLFICFNYVQSSGKTQREKLLGAVKIKTHNT